MTSRSPFAGLTAPQRAIIGRLGQLMKGAFARGAWAAGAGFADAVNGVVAEARESGRFGPWTSRRGLAVQAVAHGGWCAFDDCRKAREWRFVVNEQWETDAWRRASEFVLDCVNTMPPLELAAFEAACDDDEEAERTRHVLEVHRSFQAW